MVGAGVEMKAGSFCHGCGFWATERPCLPSIRVVTHGYEEILGMTRQEAKIFQSGISPTVAKNRFAPDWVAGIIGIRTHIM
jgi:hypothetical protein